MALKQRVMHGQVEPGVGEEKFYPVPTYCAALVSLEQCSGNRTGQGSGFPMWISIALEIVVLVVPA